MTEFVDASPALVTQLTTTLAAGIYCMNISDIGALPDAAVFSIGSFTHDHRRAMRQRLVLLAAVCSVSCGDEAATTAPTSVTSPTTVTWTTLLYARARPPSRLSPRRPAASQSRTSERCRADRHRCRCAGSGEREQLPSGHVSHGYGE